MQTELSHEALKADRGAETKLIRLESIYADPEFNCRGYIKSQDIIELAQDIAKRGLVEPIVIRPLWPMVEDTIKAKGFEYSLVAGFRRYSAYKTLTNATEIPATIRNLTNDFDCRDLNAIENLQRQDLTFWQEAKSIRHYWIAGWGRHDIATRINKSPGWVQLRCWLLEMEPEIQEAAEQGLILSTDMRELSKYHGKERLEVAGKIRDARKRGETKGLIRSIKVRDRSDTAKIRTKQDIVELMDILRETFKKFDRHGVIDIESFITPGGNSFVHRCLAWATGEISSFQLHLAIRELCDSVGVTYEIPEFRDTTSGT